MENDEKEKLKHEVEDDVKQKSLEEVTQSVENSQPNVDAAEVTQKAEEKQSLTSKTNKTQQGKETEKQETAEGQELKVKNNQTINAEKEQVPEDEDNNNEYIDLNIDIVEDDEFDSEREISPETENEEFDSQDSVQAETQQTLDNNDKLEQESDAESNVIENEAQEFDTDDDIPEDVEKDAIETEQYPEIDSNIADNAFDGDSDVDAETIASEDNGTNTSHSINSTHTSSASKKRFSLADVFVPLLFIVVLLSFGITASICAFPKYTPKDAIEYYMSYLDFSMKQSIADSDDDGAAEEFYDLLFSTGDDAKYNVVRILQNGEYTYVDVDVKYPDHTAAYNKTYNDVVVAHNYEPISDEDLYRQMAEEFEVNLSLEDNSYAQASLRFRCYQEGKCWMVDTYYVDADALANVLTGNVFELFT